MADYDRLSLPVEGVLGFNRELFESAVMRDAYVVSKTDPPAE
jgi:hypothetical protein